MLQVTCILVISIHTYVTVGYTKINCAYIMYTHAHTTHLYNHVAQNRDNIIKHSIKSLQLLYHANPCNHVLQVLPTTSLVYIVLPLAILGQVYIFHTITLMFFYTLEVSFTTIRYKYVCMWLYTPDLHHMHIVWITAIAQSLVVMAGIMPRLITYMLI